MFNKFAFVFATAIVFFPLQLSGQLPDLSSTDHFKIEKEGPQPPGVPVLIFPVDGVWLNSMLVIFEWKSGKSSVVNPTTGYILEVSRNISFIQPIIVDTITSTQVYKVLYEGRYYWRVKAFDPPGNESDFSPPDSFGVDITYPGEPTLISPIDGSFIKSRTPEFIWGASTDNLSGVDHYVLQYADHPNLNYGVISVNVKDTIYTPASPLLDTTYYWRVRAIDKANNKGCWSPRWTFTITTVGCPDIPTPLFPANFSYVNDITPTFIWTKEGGPGVWYSLQYALDESFQSARITIDSIFDTVYTVTTPLLDTTYYWRVEAIDPFGCHSGWSSPFAFTIDTTLPSIPTLILPPNHSLMCYSRPQFVWSHTAGAGGHYTLQYAFDSSFTQGVVTIVDLSDTSYTVLDTLADTTYYWHVEAIDYAGNHSGYQPYPFMFTIYTKLPNIPVLISPEDSSYTNDNTPTFVWSAVAGLGINYTLEYSLDSTFISNVIRIFNITDTNYTIPSALALIDSTYYWRVEAINQAGCHSGYQVHPFMFTIDTELPDIPTLIAPECASLLNDNTPTFVWSSTAGLYGSYTLQYALDSSFIQGVVTIPNISDTSYTSVDTLEDATYYWRVEAIDQAGNHSGYQAYPCMFIIDTGPPAIPVLIRPPNNSSINDRTPKFVWSSTAGVDGSYTLQYSGSISFPSFATITIENITETSYTLPDTLALPDGNYYWRVEAIDQAGNHSGYQSPFTFTIDTWPPNKPVLIAPPCDTTLNFNTVQFVWSSVSGCATYVLQYALNPTFTLGVVTISNITDTSYIRTLPDGIYYWRVEAVDYAGNHSGYTTPCKLTIDTQGPCPPTLISPPDRSAMCDNTPKFVWTPTAGSGGYYTLEWALDSLFTQFVTTIESIPYNQNYYQVTTPLAETTWYWHVEAIDHVGNYSGYQLHPFSFTVDTTGPAKPVLILPPNNSVTNNNVPTFVWSSTVGAVCYTLQYAKNNVFSQDVVTITNLTDTVYTVQTILADGNYYWRVEAIDEAGCHSGYQDIYHIFMFTIDTEAPCPPTLQTPCDVVISDSTPTFVWTLTLAPGEGTYTLQYARDSMFTQDVVTITGIDGNTYTVPDGQALSDGTWYWHVEAVDQAGNHSGYQLSPCMFNIGVVGPPPSAPVVTISIYDTDKLLLEWTSTACTYNVYRDTIPCDTLKTPIATNVSDTFYIDSTSGIVGNPDINYFYYVTGVCNGVESGPSNQVGEFDFRLITTPAGITNWNNVALSLTLPAVDSASKLMNAVPACSSIARWNAALQTFDQYLPGVPGAPDFELLPGYPYYVYVTKDTVWTLTGGLSTPTFNLIITGPDTTNWNEIAIPVCETTIDSASKLMNAVPACSSVARWNAALQTYDQYLPGVPGAPDFELLPGYPYQVYVNASSTWPSGGKGFVVHNIVEKTTAGITTPAISSPHLVYGSLRTSTGKIPREISFNAYIVSHPEEVLTQCSPGCSYSKGTWVVQVASFSNTWKVGDILHVDFKDSETKEEGSVEVLLSWYPCDKVKDVLLSNTSSTERNPITVEKFALSQNCPNPFIDNTQIGYYLGEDGQITLLIHNIAGQLVKTLVNERKRAGHYVAYWDGTDNDGQKAQGGIYFYTITVGEYKDTKKMLLIK